MKVIFLDVDGVLNNWYTETRTPNGFLGVDPMLCPRVVEIVQRTGAKVVLSSSWRHWPDQLPYLWENLPGVECIGRTPSYPDDPRGFEIAAWLKEHPEVDKYVILDDRTDMTPVQDHLIQTDDRVGLTQKQVEKAVRKLNK